MLKEVLKGLLWALVGAAFGVALALIFQRPIERYIDARAKAKEIPHQLLSEADKDRQQFTQISLNSASTKFFSLTENKDPGVRAEAYRGLSRTYSDWSTLRDRLGLPAGSYPDRALANAFQSQRDAPKSPETQIALAYALESLHLREGQTSTTRNKLLDDIPPSDTDVHYLKWVGRADPEAKNYPDILDPETVTNLRILVDMGDYLMIRAAGEASPNKEKDLKRAAEFCDRGFLLHPNNPLVLFCLGYVAAASGNIPKARDSYTKALEFEGDFPKARNNLAYIYAAEGDFKNAAVQFEAAVRTLDAPLSMVSICLHNLGEAYFELKDDNRACDAWDKAAALPGADKNYRVPWGQALCAFARADAKSASEFFQGAVVLARPDGKNLTDLKTFEAWKAGPRQLETADKLIKAYRKSGAQPSHTRNDPGRRAGGAL